MDEFKLNLGPFDGCIDDVSKVVIVEYPVQFYVKQSQQDCVKVFYYFDENTIESKEELDVFVLSMFKIGYQSDRIDGEESRKEVINMIGLKIISMIYEIIHTSMNIPLCLDRIVIPVKSVQVHCDTGSGTPHGSAEIGIAIFA